MAQVMTGPIDGPETDGSQPHDHDEGTPEQAGALGLIEALIRAPHRALERLKSEGLREGAQAMVGAIVVGGAAFGAIVGAYRGGVQVLYAGIKTPLLLLGTLAVCAPAFVGLAKALGVPLSPREALSLSLAACARFALVLLGLAPVVWLLEGWLGYHSTVLAISAAAAVAGLSASSLLVRNLARLSTLGPLAGALFVLVYGVVGAQTAWVLRPFVVRPRTEHVPFARPLEGDLAGSIGWSLRSAMGRYEVRSGKWLDGERRRHVAPQHEHRDERLDEQEQERGQAPSTRDGDVE